jgi:hypothetical protein
MRHCLPEKWRKQQKAIEIAASARYADLIQGSARASRTVPGASPRTRVPRKIPV